MSQRNCQAALKWKEIKYNLKIKRLKVQYRKQFFLTYLIKFIYKYIKNLMGPSGDKKFSKANRNKKYILLYLCQFFNQEYPK